MSMITLCKCADMVSTHGAMVTEQAIKRFASHLAVSLSGDSLVARYLPDRFVVLHFALRVAACRKIMERIQHGIAEEGFFKVATADDTASLFATVKSAVKPQVLEPSEPRQETKAPEPILETKPSMPSIPTGKELSDAALKRSLLP